MQGEGVESSRQRLPSRGRHDVQMMFDLARHSVHPTTAQRYMHEFALSAITQRCRSSSTKTAGRRHWQLSVRCTCCVTARTAATDAMRRPGTVLRMQDAKLRTQPRHSAPNTKRTGRKCKQHAKARKAHTNTQIVRKGAAKVPTATVV